MLRRLSVPRLSFLLKERIVAPPGFNRWRIPPVAIASHLCIGSVYSWSIFNPVLARELGVVSSAAGDWNISSIVWIFSVAIVFVGLSAALTGNWREQVGPRMVGVAAAALWGGGFIVGGAGLLLHQLWLVYLGYGVLGGCGIGLAYVSPVATLIRWFPDRRGLAGGMAIAGFGGGAIIGAPLKEFLIRIFAEAPQYLGPVESVYLIIEEGRRLAIVAGQRLEVVVAGPGDASGLTATASDGVYVVGTGGTGAAEAFFALGTLYFIVMLLAAFAYRIPAPGWTPNGAGSEDGSRQTRESPGESVHLNEAHKTPQFYLLWVVLCFNVAAGTGVISVAKTIMSDIFGSTLPGIVTPSFAALYVLMISVFNMGGRFFWASISDYIGRKATFTCFFVLGLLLYLSIPFVASAVGANPAVTWLVLFYAATMIIFTMFGGGFATIPAYLSDLFGSLHIGGIHGRLLTAWSVAGVLGPFLLTYLREWSLDNSLRDLAAQVSPAAFRVKFDAPLTSLEELIAARTVTIDKLMEIAPPGVVDPTPTLYNTTMYAMAGLLLLALIANLLVRPVSEKRRVKHTHPELAE